MLGIHGSNPIGVRSAVRQMRSGSLNRDRFKFVLTVCEGACGDDVPQIQRLIHRMGHRMAAETAGQ